jgi:hypothetical protein
MARRQSRVTFDGSATGGDVGRIPGCSTVYSVGMGVTVPTVDA